MTRRRRGFGEPTWGTLENPIASVKKVLGTGNIHCLPYRIRVIHAPEIKVNKAMQCMILTEKRR